MICGETSTYGSEGYCRQFIDKNVKYNFCAVQDAVKKLKISVGKRRVNCGQLDWIQMVSGPQNI